MQNFKVSGEITNVHRGVLRLSDPQAAGAKTALKRTAVEFELGEAVKYKDKGGGRSHRETEEHCTLTGF